MNRARCSSERAVAALTAGRLPPSMYTNPARSWAPATPWKSHVAYAVTTAPPSEWPPRTTLPPSLRAASITWRRSPTATLMPHRFANDTLELGISWMCDWTVQAAGSSQPR